MAAATALRNAMKRLFVSQQWHNASANGRRTGVWQDAAALLAASELSSVLLAARLVQLNGSGFTNAIAPAEATDVAFLPTEAICAMLEVRCRLPTMEAVSALLPSVSLDATASVIEKSV